MKQPPLRSEPWSAFVAAICLSLAGCASNQVFGQVTAEGTKVGTWTQALSGAEGGCRGGYADGFRGADLFLNGTTLRVVQDALRGPVLQLSQPTSNVRVEVDRQSCSQLDLKVDRICTGETCIETRGKATFDCKVPTGGRLSGSVSFDCW
jgi:hypothetical protein